MKVKYKVEVVMAVEQIVAYREFDTLQEALTELESLPLLSTPNTFYRVVDPAGSPVTPATKH